MRKRIKIFNYEALKAKYENKLVVVKLPKRDDYGKVIDNQYDDVVGICDYIGRNEFLNIPLVVVVNRSPITIKSVDDIELADDKKYYFEQI